VDLIREKPIPIITSWVGGVDMQRKGIGVALLQRCISIAKERGIEKVMGTVLAQKYANAESREKNWFQNQ
jgi:N-acetylglutamate synthase-like GNAT family acetyltransferase